MELVIRFGSIEGPRSPTGDDVRKALADVESWVYHREEFSIEKVSNWRPEVVDGRLVIRCVMDPPYMTAATFGLEGSSTSLGWFITYCVSKQDQFALAASINDEAPYVEGMCCGGPLTVRKDCLVPLGAAHEALTYFVERHGQSPDHLWVNWARAIRFSV